MFFTLGHGTANRESFLELARMLDLIVDVRAHPGSRRSPHFARDELALWLPQAGIGYEWRPELGGRKRLASPLPDSGWQDPGFAAYAAATAEPAWLAAADDLFARGRAEGSPKIGLLCAETLWWRCHRSLIADHLVYRGVEVWHLRPGARPTAHSEVSAPRLARYPANVLAAWEGSRRSTAPPTPTAANPAKRR
jgi:uncharacterized protein (DUF488 family)